MHSQNIGYLEFRFSGKKSNSGGCCRGRNGSIPSTGPVGFADGNNAKEKIVPYLVGAALPGKTGSLGA
jgi:hypothetical protein